MASSVPPWRHVRSARAQQMHSLNPSLTHTLPPSLCWVLGSTLP